MKYHFSEHETFREVHAVRDEIKNKFIRHEKALNNKKESLFKNKDLNKWGYEGPGGAAVIQKNFEKLQLNKEAAFTYMLQKDSRDIELEREELAFYSNSCLEEIRRVGQDNGRLLIDKFIMMSQTQCSYINNVNIFKNTILNFLKFIDARHVG